MQVIQVDPNNPGGAQVFIGPNGLQMTTTAAGQAHLTQQQQVLHMVSCCSYLAHSKFVQDCYGLIICMFKKCPSIFLAKIIIAVVIIVITLIIYQNVTVVLNNVYFFPDSKQCTFPSRSSNFFSSSRI